MIKTQYINLDMTPSGVMPVLYCSQYDIGRPLGIVVYNRGEAVDLSAYTVTIEATRTDGTAITASVTTDGNIGAFSTTATMTNRADKYPAKMVIVDGSGDRVASLAFVLCVTPGTMDENAESIEEDASLYQQYTGTVQTLIAAVRADLIAEADRAKSAENALQSEVAAEASARQAADNVLQTSILAESTARAETDMLLKAQIDQMIAPSGEAPSAAEVADARIAENGYRYDTLGNAIRGQVKDLDDTIDTNGELLSALFSYGQDLYSTPTATNKTQNGITFAWSGNVCSVTGTCVDNRAYANFRGSTSTVPIESGKWYKIRVNSSDPNILMVVVILSPSTPDGTVKYFDARNDGFLYVPDDATGLVFRYQVMVGMTVSGTVTCEINEVIKEDVTSGYPFNSVASADVSTGDGFVEARLAYPLPTGVYTVFINATSNTDADTIYVRFCSTKEYKTASVVYTKTVKKGEPTWFVFKATEQILSIYTFAAETVSTSQGYTVALIDPYGVYYGVHIDSSGETDTTDLIQTVLNVAGECYLPAGVYRTTGLTMPSGSTIRGSGDGSRIFLATGTTGTAITMGDRCTVKDVTIFGAETDIELPGVEFEPSQVGTDYIQASSFSSEDGFVQYVFATPTTSPTLSFYINAQSDTGGNELYVKFIDQNGYSASHIVASLTATSGGHWYSVPVDRAVKSIYIFAKPTVSGSSGYTVTLTDPCRLYDLSTAIGFRNGILWQGDAVEFGVINNCRIERFDGAGIRMRDTGVPVDNNLAVSDCFVRNCGAGIYIQRDSEFIKINNCTVVDNFYGILNRGGNNNIENCGIDENVVGVQIDADEGSNNGHGAISNCSINHSGGNGGYGIVIKDTGRELISNCNVYFSKVKLENTNGNIISNCGFGSQSGWEINGGQCSLFANCIVRTAASNPVTVINNDTYKIVNCFTRDGNAFPQS